MRTFVFASLLSLTAASTAVAAPTAVTWQGRILDANGTPVAGSFPVSFQLYDDATAGAAVGGAQSSTITLTDGYGSAAIPGWGSLLATTTGPLWVEASVNGTPVLPRQPVAAVPYAAVGARVTVAPTPTGAACSDSGALQFDASLGLLVICNGSSWRTIPTSSMTAGTSAATAAVSCQTLHVAEPGLTSGRYYIDPDGDSDHSDAFLAYCDMETDNGGWTLIGSSVSDTVAGWDHDENAIGVVDTPTGVTDTRLSATRVREIYAAGLGELAVQATSPAIFSKFRFTNGATFGWNRNLSGNWQYSSSATTTWFAAPATRKTSQMAPQNASNCYTGSTTVGPNFAPFHYGGTHTSLRWYIQTGSCNGYSVPRMNFWAR
jgi:hypothetical protein